MLGHPGGASYQVAQYNGNGTQENDLELWVFSVIDAQLAIRTKRGLNLLTRSRYSEKTIIDGTITDGKQKG